MFEYHTLKFPFSVATVSSAASIVRAKFMNAHIQVTCFSFWMTDELVGH